MLTAIFFSLVVFSFVNNEPWTIGDGYEYILQTASIQNHLTFGLTNSDLLLAQEQFPAIKEQLEITFNNLAVGRNGLSYSNHFGLYSFLVLPIKLILLAFNINPIYSFRITNLLLWFVSVLVVLFCLNVDDKKKFGVLTLILFNPVFFYITWIHTELYLFSFSVIALVFYYNERYSLGILFMSIAAAQNLGLLPLDMIIGIQFIWRKFSNYSENKDHNFLKFIKQHGMTIISYGIFYLPAFLPMITCYVHFGVFNRVAEVAMEDNYLFSKFSDYLIDLNLGILPYEPIILIVFISIVLKDLIKKSFIAFLNLFAVIGMLFIVSCQLQINCGMEGIMRYNVWILPCMIFYVALNLRIDNFINYCFIIIGEAVFTTYMVVLTIWGTPSYNSYLKFSPWAEFVLDKFPEIYNPSHGIFYSRATGNEMYYNSFPVVWKNENGYVRKILLSREAKNVFFNGDYYLYDSKYNLINFNELKLNSIDKGDYNYVNICDDLNWVYRYRIGKDKIYFYTDKYNANLYFKNGLSVREDWGSWTDGKTMRMELIIDDDVKTLHCHIDLNSTFYHPQPVKIISEGKIVYNKLVWGDQNIDFDFMKTSNLVVFLFEFPNAVKPSVVLNSTDNRELALGLKTLVITESEIVN